MMGPIHRFQDNAHLARLIEAVGAAGILVAEDHRAELPGAYWFRKGFGKIHGSIRTEERESVMYFGFGHPFNPLLWKSDGNLQKKIESIFLSNGSERIDLLDTNPEKETSL